MPSACTCERRARKLPEKESALLSAEEAWRRVRRSSRGVTSVAEMARARAPAVSEAMRECVVTDGRWFALASGIIAAALLLPAPPCNAAAVSAALEAACSSLAESHAKK